MFLANTLIMNHYIACIEETLAMNVFSKRGVTGKLRKKMKESGLWFISQHSSSWSGSRKGRVRKGSEDATAVPD